VHDDPGAYAETLWAPLSWWCMAAGAVLAVWWCFFVATPAWWAWTAAAAAGAAVFGGLLHYSRTPVASGPDGLRAGRALLPPAYIGRVDVLDRDQTRRLLGVGADARAYLLVRSYCAGAVRVAVRDERDPTPYWLVSTRHPDDLARHLRRVAGSGGAAVGTQHT
jgi:Protein of unknown function (DUF3093)